MKDGVIGRPQEIIPLCVACFVLGRMLNTTSAWGKILKFGVFSTMLGSGVMLFSHKLYDFQFNLAHGFKMVSYFFMDKLYEANLPLKLLVIP